MTTISNDFTGTWSEPATRAERGIVGRAGRSQQLFWALLFLIVCAGAAVRWALLGRASLWFDEGYTAWVASLPCRSIWRVIQVDTAPPLYYLLLHGWTRAAGPSEAGLRSLSAACSTAALAVGVLTARRVFSDPVAVAGAAVLLAAAYIPTAFAHEARCYGLMLLLTALDFSLVLALAERFTATRAAALVLCWAASLYTNDAMLLDVAATAVAWWCAPGAVPRRRRLLQSAGVGGAAVALYLPWLPTMLQQSRRLEGNFWLSRPGLHAFPDLLSRLSGVNPDLFHNTTGAALAVLAVLCGAAVTGLLVKRAAELNAALLAVGIGPVVVAFVLSRTRTPVFIDRSLIGSCTALPLLLAAPLQWLSVPALRWSWAAGLAVFFTVAVASQKGQMLGEHQEDWRGVCAFVQTRAGGQQDSRLVVCVANEGELLFDYYARGGDYAPTPAVTGAPESFFAPDMNPPRTMRRVLRDADLQAVEAAAARLQPGQIVLLQSHQWWADKDERVRRWLEQHDTQVEHRQFDRIDVYRFRAKR